MPSTLSPALIGAGLMALLFAGLALAQWLARRRLGREVAELRQRLARESTDRDRAVKLARSEGELLDALVTELHGPGMALARAADTLAQDAVGGPGQRLADSLRRSARLIDGTLSTLADRMLLQDGRLKLAAAPVDVPVLMHELVDLRRASAGPAGAAPRLDITAFGNQCVLADRDRLAQLLGQLLDAALAQADASGVAVTLTETVVSPKRLALRIDMRRAAAVHPDHAAVLTLLPTLEPLPPGLGARGLALSNARQLVALMGGQLEISLGKNDLLIRFDVELPVAEVSEIATLPQSRDGFVAPEPRVARLRRVLLVEDNRITQFVTTDTLARMGFDVATASDGAEALALLDRLDVDLVLTDCDMPDIDGPELARRLRADPRHTGLTIIAVTVDDSERMRADCLAAGMDGFLSKPIEPHKLQLLFDQLARR